MNFDPVVGARNLDQEAVERCASDLRDVYRYSKPIRPLRELYPSGSIADAYAIQNANATCWLDSGRVAVGAKVGFANAGAKQQFGAHELAVGTLFSDMEALDGGEIDLDALLQPRVQGVMAFFFKSDPDVNRITSAELLGCIDFVLPAIEIADCRFNEWDTSPFDSIADNACAGAFVLGAHPTSVNEIDLRMCGMVLERNGEPVSFGAGAAYLGNPLHGLRHAVLAMHSLGRPLSARDVVLSGPLGPTVPASAGDHVTLRINGLGNVRTRLSQGTSEGVAHG